MVEKSEWEGARDKEAKREMIRRVSLPESCLATKNGDIANIELEGSCY